MDGNRMISNLVKTTPVQQEYDLTKKEEIKSEHADDLSARRIKVKEQSPDILPYKLDQPDTVDIPSDTSSTDQIVKKEDEEGQPKAEGPAKSVTCAQEKLDRASSSVANTTDIIDLTSSIEDGEI